jgi:RHS repeat-associated protein
MTGNGKTITYKYNDSGIITQKTVNGVTTTYHLVGDKVTYEENGTDKIYYTYGASDNLVSMNLSTKNPDATWTVGVEYYYIRNAQGDIIGLFDGNGTQVVSYTYDSWGKPFVTNDENNNDNDVVKDGITGSIASTVGVKNPHRYRGYRYDTESELYYLQSRYYNAKRGRFINADGYVGTPGELLSHNLFTYCANNPINRDDPNGKFMGELLTAVAIAFPPSVMVMLTAAAVALAVVAIYTVVDIATQEYRNSHVSYSDNSTTSNDISSTSSSGGGGGSSSPKPPPKNRKPTDGHHSYPKALGGAAAQVLTQIPINLHKIVHATLYQFENGWLAPKKNYKGIKIQDLYGAKAIQDGLMRFYNSDEMFKILIDPLTEAIKFTGK